MADNLPAEEAAPAPARGRNPRSGGNRQRRRLLRLGLLALGPIVVVGIAAWYMVSGAPWVSTDNAYIQATMQQISPEISGQVIALGVGENQHVSEGQELFRIDPEPVRIVLRQAEAELAKVRSDIEALKSSYQSKQQEVAGAKADLDFAQRDLARQEALARTRVASEARLDEARHAVEAASASAGRMQAELDQIVAELDGDPSISPERHSRFLAAQAERDRAALDLRRTVVQAPSSGVISGADNLRPGTHVDAGRTALSLVADSDLWIDANFKETDLTWVRPGQPVTIEVDTYPSREWHGAVASISPATGAEFSLLPPQNATGNWVKVVQRIPVRIEIQDGGGDQRLRAGMSTTVDINTGHQFEMPHLVSSALAFVGGQEK
jgi:membrane fusion protein (multidrug efflux system)